jgi:hypothetical protein
MNTHTLHSTPKVPVKAARSDGEGESEEQSNRDAFAQASVDKVTEAVEYAA